MAKERKTRPEEWSDRFAETYGDITRIAKVLMRDSRNGFIRFPELA